MIPTHAEKGLGKAVACLLDREAAVLTWGAVEGHPVSGRPLLARVPAVQECECCAGATLADGLHSHLSF